MEFKNEELIDREIEIAGHLLSGLSISRIEQKMGLSKKILDAHIKNMMRKLKTNDRTTLLEILKQKQNHSA